MDRIIERLNKLSLPATILIASLVLGLFYYVSETSKQKSIERQQNIKIEQERKEKEQTRVVLDACLRLADSSYSEYWARSCKSIYGVNSKADCELPSYRAAQVEKSNQDNKDDCFKKYPQK